METANELSSEASWAEALHWVQKNANKVKPLGNRFWSKVDIGGPQDCWEWQAYRTQQGYGHFRFDGKSQLAHRLVAGLRRGDEGQALHSCDNPPCCNPAHISIGTMADNMAQKVARGRQAKGERAGPAKLTEAEVLAIRARYATGRVMQHALADEYGVSGPLISHIVNRKAWAHLA